MSKFSGIIAERFNRMNAGQQAKILALIERHDDSRATGAEVLQAQEAKIDNLELVAKAYEAYEDQVMQHNKTLDDLKYAAIAANAEARRGDELQVEVTRQAALIEKCEKALASAIEWAAPMRDAPKSSRPEWFDEARRAIAAIAAQKGGAA